MSKKDKTRFLPPHILTKLAVILGLAFAMPNVFAASITPYYGFKSGDNYVLEVEADGSNGKVKTGATNEAGYQGTVCILMTDNLSSNSYPID